MSRIPTDTDLMVEALRARAKQRESAAGQLSVLLAETRATTGRDVRSQAVKVVDELALAGRLRDLADRLDRKTLWLSRHATPDEQAESDALEDAIFGDTREHEDPDGETITIDGLGEVDLLPDHQTDDEDDGDVPDVLAILEETPADA